MTNQIAVQDKSPAALVTSYQNQWAQDLPTHVLPKQWTRQAAAAVKRDPKLTEAANNNITVFLQTVARAAALGLTPGTDEYYLVPQSPKSGAPKEVMGIVGWQGLVELMYRAGAVASVIAEIVYDKDEFHFVPGQDERPRHVIDWKLADRGTLVLAYAYATMKDGATSKVVVMNATDIARVRSKSRGASYDSSPWKTDEPAMWLKSAVRQLAKWVPTSAEYRREQLRAAQEVWNERNGARTVELGNVNTETGEVPMTNEVVEGELLDD